MTKLHITTLGCPKNQVDSDHLIRSLRMEGLSIVDDAEDADLLIVNTCGFIRDAKEESIEEILRLSELKKGQEAGGNGQEKKLLVFGCLAQRYRSEIEKELPEIDCLLGVGEEEKIIEYCKSVGSLQSAVGSQELPDPGVWTPDHLSYAYLKIAEGCDKKCTFCVIPSIRGRFRSTPSEEILREAQEHIAGGIRELVLVAQDITNYGKEWEGYNLSSLLKDLAAVEGDFKIRLLYLYPTEITEELLETIAGEEKIMKYLDIPLQHSEDRILRLMGRRGTRKEYTKLIRTIRRIIPQVTLRTTFIVGFPSETEEDFQGLVEFIEEIRFDRLGAFTYSQEEGTPSARLKGQVPEKVMARRLDDIMQRQAEISLEKNRELIGRSCDALIDEIDGDVILARLDSHAPEVDGVVIIELDPRPLTLDSLKVGDLVTVEIVDAYEYDLKGRITGS
ncbi:MAG: 30S ribosomal protein S12 methylthiotransferase RimO [Thermodesulfovibrionales bacterium]|jgi:ribosomal protein S12 methylthiotransferase